LRAFLFRHVWVKEAVLEMSLWRWFLRLPLQLQVVFMSVSAFSSLMRRSSSRSLLLAALPAVLLLTACGTGQKAGDVTATGIAYPKNPEDRRELNRGKLTGEGGFNLFGSGNKGGGGGVSLGVNAFLWRATLDTLSFLPIASADPFGGTVLTDWYEDPKTPGERFKVNAVIMDKELRADALKVKLFKQGRTASGGWEEQAVSPRLEREMEDTILTRARQLRVQTLATN
jgi:hypothetical protein